MQANVDQALALIPQALRAATRAANSPSRSTVTAAQIAIQAVRDSVVPRTALGQRARAVLSRATSMLEQYAHSMNGLGRLRRVRQQGVGVMVMPPPLFPMRGGGQGPVRSITGPATGPAVSWLPAGGGAVRRYNIMFQVIPMLHEVQRILRAARGGIGATPETAVALKQAGTGAKKVPPPSLLDHIVCIENSLPQNHPIRLRLVQARADTLTQRVADERRKRLKTTPGAEQSLSQRVLRAVYKASFVYAGLRLLDMRPKKALLISAGIGAAVEWVGLEETIKAGALTAARTFTDF